jgi:ferrous iron transport protein B
MEPRPTYVRAPIFRTGIRRLSAPVTSCRDGLGRNTFAGLIDSAIQALAGALAEWFGQLPSPAREYLTARYGLMTMGPLLFVWAVPSVVLYTLFLSI